MPRQTSPLNVLIRPYRRRFLLPLAAALASVALLIWQSSLLAGMFAGWLSQSASGTVPSSQGLRALPWLILCLLLRPLLSLFKERSLQKTSLAVRHNLRRRLLASIAALGPARNRFGSDGALSTQILEQVDALDGYISRFYVQSILAAATPVIIAAAVSAHSRLAALLMLLTAPLVPVFMILAGSLAAEKNRSQLRTLAQLGGRFLDLVRGLPTLKRLNATGWAGRQVSASAEAYRRRTMSVLALAFLSGAVLELFASLAVALVAVYLGLGLLGVLPWAQGEVPVPYESALFILLLAPEFYLPLRQLGNDYHAKAQAQAAAESLAPLLAAAPPRQCLSENKKQALFANAPEILLDNVHILGDGGRIRLAETRLHIPGGARIGICGKSGIGKSSLLQALLGFADYEGHILINGRECAGLDRALLRRQTGFLAQTPTLLPGTIAENLRLADAGAGEAQMRQVLETVGLWDLIQRLPQGLDTQLGERGRGLSGGQQQRLSLAQLLLRDAPLWLLDEPAAHLDEAAAAELYETLGKISTDRTVLLVSHRPSAVSWLDKTVELGEHREG